MTACRSRAGGARVPRSDGTAPTSRPCAWRVAGSAIVPARFDSRRSSYVPARDRHRAAASAIALATALLTPAALIRRSVTSE